MGKATAETSDEGFVKVVYIAAKLGQFGGDVLEGVIDITDLIYLKDLIDPLSLVGSIDFEQLKADFENLDRTKLEEFALLFDEEFDIPQEGVEQWMEESIAAGIDAYYAIKTLVDIQKSYFVEK